MRVVIFGSGNVATILGRKMVEAGHIIVQVWARTEPGARGLADRLSAAFTTDLQQVDPTADIYLLAVSDAAIPELAASIHLGRKQVVHTAGSVSKDVLQACSTNYGILYPLQSLRKEMVELPAIPFLVDGNTEDDTALLMDFAQTLSPAVQVAHDRERLQLHLAAVMVSNFTNHLYVLAEQYCKQSHVDFQLLVPLINAVAARLYQFSPAQVQTGPAVRNDQPTIQKHLELLNGHPALQEMYRWFTTSIQLSMVNGES